MISFEGDVFCVDEVGRAGINDMSLGICFDTFDGGDEVVVELLVFCK